MTKQELNRDIKILLSYQKKHENEIYESYNEYSDYFKNEYLRLYRADNNFEYMNKKSIMIMLRLNLRYRFVVLHHFGINIDLEKL